MRAVITMATVSPCLLVALALIATLCYRHADAMQKHETHRAQARLAADTLRQRQNDANDYNQMLLQAQQLRLAGALGAAVASGVRELQFLAMAMPAASYNFSSLPDTTFADATLRRAAIDFRAKLTTMEEFAVFMDRLTASGGGVFRPQRCRFAMAQGEINFDCELEWASVSDTEPRQLLTGG